MDLEHADKVLSMQETNKAEPAEVEEVIKVVTAAKLMTKVVNTAATTITAAVVPKASAPRKRRVGMTYTERRPIFKKHYNSIQAFLEKGEKEIEEEGSKRKSESSKQRAAKKQRIDKEVEELKTHLQIIPNDEDDVYTESYSPSIKGPFC
nr:hypothetical protein [Tanacetum cinerariifolium]